MMILMTKISLILFILFFTAERKTTFSAFGYSDISPAECVGDVLVLHHDHEITKENGELFLTDYPESISKDSSGFDQLIKCIGNDQRVEKDEQGQPQEIHVSRFMVPDLNHRVPISRQMRYALHLIQCVAEYAAIDATDTKIWMSISRSISIDPLSLPDKIESGMDGFEELRKCIGSMENPPNSEKSLIGEISILFGTNKRKLWEKPYHYSKKHHEIALNSSDMNEKEIINLQKLKQNPAINKLLSKYLSPSPIVGQKIADEISCVGKFLVVKMAARTKMESKNWTESLLLARMVEIPDGKRLNSIDESLYRSFCDQSIIRQNALLKHGICGMLKFCYGNILVDQTMRKDLDQLSMFLAENLVFHQGEDVETIARLTSRESVAIARSIGSSNFRVVFDPNNVDLSYRIGNDKEKLSRMIFGTQNTPLKELWDRTLKELVELFQLEELYLSEDFMIYYFVAHKEERRRLYENLTCIADYLIIYEKFWPVFEDGKISTNGYKYELEGSLEGGGPFSELAKCVGEDWIEKGQDGQGREVEVLRVINYLANWDTEHYQVSEQLEKLLANLGCIADYLILHNEESRIKVLGEQRVKIEEETIPKSIEVSPENYEEVQEMLKCLDERYLWEGYRILGQKFPPFIRFKETDSTEEIRQRGRMRREVRNIVLKEPGEQDRNRMLKYMYVGKELLAIATEKFACIAHYLMDRGNVNTKLVVSSEPDGEHQPSVVYRRIETQNLPEKLIELTNCGRLFQGAETPEEIKRLEERLNRVELVKVSGGVLIEKEMHMELDAQSMCLADFLALRFGIGHIVRVSDPDQMIIVDLIGASRYKFVYRERDEFLGRLRRILEGSSDIIGTIRAVAKCIPKVEEEEGEMLRDPEDEWLYKRFVAHLDLFDQDQLFLSNNVDRSMFLTETTPNSDDPVCPICHEEFGELGIVKKLPNCKHYFHHSCIKRWLEQSNKCPMCRANVFSGYFMHQRQ